MAKIRDNVPNLELIGSDGGSVLIRYGNLGEPFREGVEINVVHEGKHVCVLLDARETTLLRDKLNALLDDG
jgi:hypothetical protein